MCRISPVPAVTAHAPKGLDSAIHDDAGMAKVDAALLDHAVQGFEVEEPIVRVVVAVFSIIIDRMRVKTTASPRGSTRLPARSIVPAAPLASVPVARYTALICADVVAVPEV